MNICLSPVHGVIESLSYGSEQKSTMQTSKNFYTQNVSIGPYFMGIENDPKRYDINPPHQRGLVKPPKWNVDVIVHLYEFCTLMPIYYHTRKSDGMLENLDGKQRTTAIVKYMKNEFPLPKNCGLPRELMGYYKDLPDTIKRRFYNIQIPLCVTDAELTRDEIRKFFSRVQRSSNTTSGECINADLDNNTRNMILEYIENNADLDKYCTIPADRFKRHDLMTKCIYVYVNLGYNQILPPNEKIMTWSHSFDDTRKFAKAMDIFYKVIKLMNTYNITQKACQVMAMFSLACDVGFEQMVVCLMGVFNNNLGKCFEDFKSTEHCSKAVVSRYAYLKSKIVQ
jgi:hypothetical protein